MLGANKLPSEYFDSNISLEGNEKNDQPNVNFIPVSLVAQNDSPPFQLSKAETKMAFLETSLNLSVTQKKNPLLLFTDNSSSKMKISMRAPLAIPRKNPKKSYYRTKLIRRFIKLVGKFFDRRDEPDNMIADVFYDYLSENGGILKNYIEIDFGLTIRRTLNHHSKKPKINDEFCEKFFSFSLVLEGYKKYLERIFSDDEETLCNLFGFSCCSENYHISKCKLIWSLLQSWSSNSLIGNSL